LFFLQMRDVVAGLIGADDLRLELGELEEM